ncbi:lysozyme [Phyllobacterium sp. TAF24]|uniref:lysozyme n=1 Tax=Phyllobacterium sp. TAF24 TaxID=3233068 RepID=UPI003F983320
MTSRLKKAGIGLTVAGALAVSFIGGKEGMKTKAYLDIVGIPTVCFGETRGVKLGDQYTPAQCREQFGAALVDYETGMRACLKAPDAIPAKPYVAFLSASYNIGVPTFCRSSMARLANAGDLRGACNALMLYVNAGGRKVQGLINRRMDEKKLCLEGISR